MKDSINMGGVATLFTMNETSGIGALTGAITGSAFGAPNGPPKDLGNGEFELSLYHWFLDVDGSTINTHDREILRFDEKSGTYLMEVWYTVVSSTGRFEGYRGTFKSRGWLKADNVDGSVAGQSVGSVRFEGQLVRE